MKADDRRKAKRKIVLRHARASDLTGKIVVKCVVRDASRVGCLIVSNQVGELPEEILLEVDNVKEPRKGIIVRREKKLAGVKFV